ncbi:MAG: Asp-tRNA(Asn)/Glu-tRNA(Gln) amidotransferase subunit GatB [Candidatus Schekmanbacteria bacterium]|nr:Asp-tRNA(Asn)/Glu-tRNA(Gln) amidotransferase subunit GatB [Candidatus Schekmanbacteria bacterium]
MSYQTVIGLEVHAQLLTNSKMFCGCSTKFGQQPNSSACPVCLGMPGVLPVMNAKAVELALKVALATNCRIAPHSIMARKNYFYPDLPKAYQISQFELPLAEKGWLEIEAAAGPKKIGITRIHMEEDAGKLLHEGVQNGSHVDLNRCGTPLIEIVSEPEISSPEEAKLYMQKLRDILDYLEVCDCNMEEGSLRCDANISLKKPEAKSLGTKAEIKNMNSFRFLQRALEYEEKRQAAELEAGGKIIQETRLWDSNRGITVSMRSKEEAHDYRYFPEPDLVPIEPDPAWVEQIGSVLPELPDAKKQRFIAQYGLPDYDAQLLTGSRALADYYERCAAKFSDYKQVSNWVMGDLAYHLKQDNRGIVNCPISPENLAQLLDLMKRNVISGKIAKTVFEEMYAGGKEPQVIVKEKGLQQVADESAIEKIVDGIIAGNPQAKIDFQAGKQHALGFLVGQVMKASKGKANPQMVNKLLQEKLKA